MFAYPPWEIYGGLSDRYGRPSISYRIGLGETSEFSIGSRRNWQLSVAFSEINPYLIIIRKYDDASNAVC